ncbi:unnamed protein product [Amoebophrya sp. A25]|nr:unnamed protein product [Amoebophrya sp. A25]|eukprot:GSA25T00003215001.1
MNLSGRILLDMFLKRPRRVSLRGRPLNHLALKPGRYSRTTTEETFPLFRYMCSFICNETAGLRPSSLGSAILKSSAEKAENDDSVEDETESGKLIAWRRECGQAIVEKLFPMLPGAGIRDIPSFHKTLNLKKRPSAAMFSTTSDESLGKVDDGGESDELEPLIGAPELNIEAGWWSRKLRKAKSMWAELPFFWLPGEDVDLVES